MASISAGVPYENHTNNLYGKSTYELITVPFFVNNINMTCRSKTCSAYGVECIPTECDSEANFKHKRCYEAVGGISDMVHWNDFCAIPLPLINPIQRVYKVLISNQISRLA